MFQRNPRSHAALLLAFALAPALGLALTSDRSQPMHIEADNVELDDQRGISVYQGDVVVTQGSMRITADTLRVFTTNGELDRMVAEGTPATYKQRPDNKDEDVRARALTMEYFAERDTVILTEKAHLWQGPNTFTSKRIVYDVGNDHVDAGKQAGGDRVHITIHPQQEQQGGGSAQ